MEENCMNYDKKKIKGSIIKAMFECSKRGLLQSMTWLGELSSSLGDIPVDCSDGVTKDLPQCGTNECDNYFVAKCYFDFKEYDRCAYHTKTSSLPHSKFLHYYSKYLSYEKKKLENKAESSLNPDPKLEQNLLYLYSELKSEYYANNLDGYGLYLYGVVLKKINLDKDALTILFEAVHREPMHWGGWMELAHLATNSTKVEKLSLPDHWMTKLFAAHVFLELEFSDRALEIYAKLDSYFPNNPYIISQIANCHNTKRDVSAAIDIYGKLSKQDPYRFDHLDKYSHCLFVQSKDKELSYLAHHVAEVDKYRMETCCIIGNYYGVHSDHHKAILYFQRALKLNPQYLPALNLMGLEFLEIKNASAAIQSFRQVIEVNPRNYQAWNGLGVAYEILQLYSFSLSYYKQAQRLRFHDERMLNSLGVVYKKLDKKKEAIKCFSRARALGDGEDIATFKLCELYIQLNDVEQAVKGLNVYVAENENIPNKPYENLNLAYQYLADYYFKENQLDKAYIYAKKCLNITYASTITKEKGKALLKMIMDKGGPGNREETQF